MTTNSIAFHSLKNDIFVNIAEQVTDICASAQFPAVPQYAAALSAMQTAGERLDAAYLESRKSYNTDDMKRADGIRDNYSSATRGILNGYAYLPDTEPLKRKAQLALQVFRDFKYDTGDSYTGQSAKIDNMTQRFQEMQADLEAMGVWTMWQQVVAANQEVKQYFATRNAEYADRVKQAMLTARTEFIGSYQQALQTINAMLVLATSAELESVARRLNALYDYCQQYYLGGGSTSAGNTSGGTSPNPSQGGENSGGNGGSDNGGSGSGSGNGGSTPVTPVTPDNGGGSNNGGGYDDGTGTGGDE